MLLKLVPIHDELHDVHTNDIALFILPLRDTFGSPLTRKGKPWGSVSEQRCQPLEI